MSIKSNEKSLKKSYSEDIKTGMYCASKTNSLRINGACKKAEEVLRPKPDCMTRQIPYGVKRPLGLRAWAMPAWTKKVKILSKILKNLSKT